jgi:hypothetical protein
VGAKAVAILGTRGIPAQHGGFETLTERLSLYLVERGWEVTVYCQSSEAAEPRTDFWNRVRRVTFGASATGPHSTASSPGCPCATAAGEGR